MNLFLPVSKTHVGTLVCSASNPVRAITSFWPISTSVVFSPESSEKRFKNVSRKASSTLGTGATDETCKNDGTGAAVGSVRVVAKD